MRTKIPLTAWALTFFLAGTPLGPGQAHAQESPSPDAEAATKGEAFVTKKMAGEFRPFLGQDAEAVVSGLRNGTPITLSETTPTETKAVTISPPTGKMGYGNVRISLALAKHQLNQAGITEPTPSQLQAALTGGTVTNSEGTTTTLPGVLTLRSQGMGWGEIARSMGTKLGPVVSGMKRANQSLAPGERRPAGRSGIVVQRESEPGSGIVTGTGEPARPGGQTRIVTGSGRSVEGRGGPSSRGQYGRGIVDGLGDPVGVHRGGIVSGSGLPADPRGGGVPGRGLGLQRGRNR